MAIVRSIKKDADGNIIEDKLIDMEALTNVQSDDKEKKERTAKRSPKKSGKPK